MRKWFFIESKKQQQQPKKEEKEIYFVFGAKFLSTHQMAELDCLIINIYATRKLDNLYFLFVFLLSFHIFHVVLPLSLSLLLPPDSFHWWLTFAGCCWVWRDYENSKRWRRKLVVVVAPTPTNSLAAACSLGNIFSITCKGSRAHTQRAATAQYDGIANSKSLKIKISRQQNVVANAVHILSRYCAREFCWIKIHKKVTVKI